METIIGGRKDNAMNKKDFRPGDKVTVIDSRFYPNPYRTIIVEKATDGRRVLIEYCPDTWVDVETVFHGHNVTV